MPTKSLRERSRSSRFVANPSGSMTAAAIARAVKLPRPTVYRMLCDLEEAGYVLREPGAGIG